MCRGNFARSLTAACALLLAVVGCSDKKLPDDPLEARAQQFVRLVLELGLHDRKEVDAYWGPSALDPRNKSKAPPLTEIRQQAQQLLADSAAAAPVADKAARAQALHLQLQHFDSLLAMLGSPARLPFDEEARRVYGIDPDGHVDAEAAPRILKELDQLIGGTGPVPFRVAKFRNQFVVPADKRQAVFARALEECRQRTLAHWKLPEDEQLTVQWTRDVGAAWHKYEGQHRSTLKVNPVAVAFIGSMLDVACHEGYPGHHAQFLAMEADAGPTGLPVESMVALMRSPATVLREGAANYGVQLVLSPAERLAFERDVLFPMAGLNAADAEKQARVHHLIGELALSVVPILSDYRDSVISFNTATFMLERQALISSPAALLKFVDELGAYATGYTVARNAVRDYVVDTHRQSGADPWLILRHVLAGPDTRVLGIKQAAPAAPAAQAATTATSGN